MGFLSFVSSISCFFLLLLSLHLFFAERGVKLLNYLLSILFLSRFSQVLVSLLVHSNEKDLFPFFYQVFTPVYYVAPACFYLYVTSFINGRTQLRKFDWLHFIPAVLALIHVLPLPFLPAIKWDAIAVQIMDNKQLFIMERSGLFPPSFCYLGRPLLLLAYLSAAWYSVLRSKVIDNHVNADGKRWILFCLRAGTYFQIMSFFPLLIWNAEEPLFNVLFILMNCLVLLVIVVFIMHRPKLFYGYLFVSVNFENQGEKEIETKREIKAKKEIEEIEAEEAIRVIEEVTKIELPARKVNLMPERLVVYSEMMKSFMENKQPYLEPDFQMVDLASEINIPVHHCSFVINKFMEKNFRDWINSYRINFFIDQYPLKSDVMTIEAVAYESGFKSLGTFYNAFKKETGLMPKTFFAGKKIS